jgi:hypothetical protein
MKRITALKLTFVATFVAALGAGCASTGYARYDDNNSDTEAAIGAPAQSEMGEDRMAMVDEDAEGEARVTVSALAANPETRADWVNRFPFHDQNWRIQVIETYTFAAPDSGIEVATTTRSDLPEFSASLPPGSVFVEAAGGAGEVRTGRVIQHSPNPIR